MKTTQIWRTEATSSVTVSTVLVHEGGQRWYETSFIAQGRVSDGERCSRKFEAGINHDACVAAAKGWTDPHNSKRQARLAAFLQEG